MVKKEYMKPAMRVVQLRQQHIICASNGYVRGVSNSDGITWKEGDVFSDTEDDM